jgi:hypothetical protein
VVDQNRLRSCDDPEFGELLPDIRAMAEEDEFARGFVVAYDQVR